jgi:hypothetical protein
MERRSIAPDARAAVFAAVCTVLAVAAHMPMSGSGVPMTAVMVGAAAVFCFARMAASLGERGLVSIGLLVGGSQFALHVLFEVAQAPAAPQVAAVPMPGMDGMTGMAGAPSGSALLGLSYGMTIAHVLGAVVAAWWLRRGEAALFAVARRARAVVSTSWRMLAWWAGGALSARPMRRAMPTLGSEPRRSYVARVLLFSVIRRGPPAVCR